MRIALATGIFPPDIGGPATHALDLRDELRSRGHVVTVVTLGDATTTERGPGIVRFPRGWSWQARFAAVAGWLVRSAPRYDVVYATGLLSPAVAGAKLAGRPIVVKVVGDHAWERGRRLGLTGADFDDFQNGADAADPRVRAMRAVQNAALRAADEITAPSETLHRTIEGWLGGPVPVELIPNGVRAPARRARRPSNPPLVYVGRLVAHKRVDRIVEAVASVPDVRLDVLGDGPEADRLSDLAAALDVDERVSFRGATGHDQVMSALSKAAALVLASDYEGLPHVVLEALVCGTPVISPPVGGVPEVVSDGTSGIVLLDASVRSLADAIGRITEDRELAGKLRAGAREAGAEWRIERTADQIEALLERAIARRPRAVFVGKTSVDAERLRPKLRVMGPHVRSTIVGTGRPSLRSVGVSRTYVLPASLPKALERVLFYSVAPALGVVLAAARSPSAVVCQSPYEGVGAVTLARALPRRVRPRVVVEVHGDWRSASRLYGTRGRERLAPIGEWLAAAALRRADRVRVIGAFTEDLARGAGYAGEIDRFPAFSEYDLFLDEPTIVRGDAASMLFAGALERAKGVDVLLDAWPLVHARRPGARLVVAGRGSLAGEVDARALVPGSGIDAVGAVPRERVRELMDESALLVLPSRSEGLGRVVLEAWARERPVVATRVGGITELVADGETGLLVPPDDPVALADAVVRLLDDADTARAMGERGRRQVVALDPAGAFESGVARLARWIASP
jgi:glycosyltransferase involved in cell wall biosynthesis